MLDREQVQHVAHLARLQLSPEEEEQFTSQLADILAYVEQLKQLDTDSVDPTFHALDDVTQVLRPDQVETWADPEMILEGAPDREERFFKVPRILDPAAE